MPGLLDERVLGLLRRDASSKARARGLRELSELVGASAYGVPSHEARCEDYDVVIATSDLHSDFPKTLQLMRAARLIEFPVDGSELDPYKDVYDVRLITETRWVARRTMFVICGDLVDGRRPGRGDVNDKEGSFEIRLHCFLYNMRVRAEQVGSAVRFTIGNHDMHTVIRNDGELSRYVSAASLAFFGTMEARSAALRPFYECSPYLIFSLTSARRPEVVFVHGGLRQNAESLYDEVYAVQRRVDAARREERLRIISEDFEGATASDARHVTWRRDYARKDRCMYNEDMRRRGCELIVVGHCHTMTGDLADLAQVQCKSQESNGCMLLACGGEGSPLIAFVDTAMSSCFHASADAARERPTQMLLLTKRPDARRGRAHTTSYTVGRLVVGPSLL